MNVHKLDDQPIVAVGCRLAFGVLILLAKELLKAAWCCCHLLPFIETFSRNNINLKKLDSIVFNYVIC